jgi:hypothetical protein
MGVRIPPTESLAGQVRRPAQLGRSRAQDRVLGLW